MSIWGGRQRREFQGITPEGMIPPRATGRYGSTIVTDQTALRHSAVWACIRLRADLMSTFPVNTWRNVVEIPVKVPNAPILVTPGGDHWPMTHWAWASQADLDRCGNAIGLITEVNALGLPARIDLYPSTVCSVIQRRGETDWQYRIDGKVYPRSKVWHERQFPASGTPLGLSPVAYAAYSVGEYLSIQQFALEWFGGGAVPKARMKNVAKKLKSDEVETTKQWYRDVISNGDLLVHGADWEYDMIQAQQAGVEWLDSRRYNLADVCRFFGCPADLIEAAISAPGTLTYQNALQRNLQFLVMQLKPAITRREMAWSSMLPQPRYVKLDTDELLQMDPETLAKVIAWRIDARTLAPSEARGKYYGLPPLTPEQEAEIARLFPPTPDPSKTPVPPTRSLELADWMMPELIAPRSPLALSVGERG